MNFTRVLLLLAYKPSSSSDAESHGTRASTKPLSPIRHPRVSRSSPPKPTFRPDYLPTALDKRRQKESLAMRSITKVRVALAALSAAGATTMATNSYAIDCNDASIMNPVYVTGSSAVEPFMQALGASLYPSGTTIVYQKQGS